MISIEDFKIDKKNLKQIDLTMIFALVLLCLFSLANIYSATRLKYGNHYIIYQLMWIAISIVVCYIILCVDYNIIVRYADIFYWICILMLIYTAKFGTVVNGAKAWIRIGSNSIEPGEFVKLALILIISKKINNMDFKINRWKNLLTIFVYLLIPLAFILKQPDLGVAMICFFIVLGIVFVGGLDLKILCVGLALIAAMIPIVWNSGFIKDYQKERMTAFLNQNANTQTVNYQLTQSKIAIGSGGIWGKGFLKGTQTNKGIIPESSTDFIYAVIGEQWGLAGGIFLIFLYTIVLVRIISISKHAKEVLGSLICAGTASGLIFSIFTNIGMTIGISPITGITLPFISCGGSSILTNLASMALVLNVGMRRKKINF